MPPLLCPGSTPRFVSCWTISGRISVAKLPAKQPKPKSKAGPPPFAKPAARNALSRGAQFGSAGQIAAVRSKVSSKFPGIGKKAKS